MAIFVGRQRELASLGARLDSVRDGTAGVCLISGEPGIGKTRLATEVAAAAAERGCTVRWGRCWEGAGAPALWPWTQVLDGGGSLPAPADGRLETDDDRFVVYEAVAARLRAQSEARPLMVVLDDLHWADRLSLLVLQFVARHLQAAPVLIVGTYREAEAQLDAEHGSILGHLARHATTMPLRGLTTAEIRNLVTQAYDVELSDATAVALREATAGNPFFVDEVMRLLIAEGAPDAFDARRVPHGVREATRRRLELLPPDVQVLLRTAAVVGRDVPVAVLEGITGSSRAELNACVDTAVDAGLVAREHAGNRFRFTHALVRAALYGDLGTAERAALHRRAGDALERVYGGDLDEHAAELAHHFAEAQTTREAIRAARYDLAAGADAINRFAYEQAADHARHGLQALASTPDPDLRVRADLHLLEADAYVRLSDADRLKEAASRAAADARAAGSNEHLARAAIAYGTMASAWEIDPDGVDLCESALDAVGATRPDLRARLLSSLAWMHATAGDLDGADRPSERGLELARELGDHRTLCRALYVRQEVYYGTARAADQLGLGDELVTVAERHGDVYWRAQGHRCRALPRLALGDVKGFAEDAEAMAKLGATLRSRVHANLGHSWRGVLALLAGRFGEVEAHTNKALSALPRDPDAIKSYGSQLFWLRHEQGRLGEVIPLVAMAIEQEPGLVAVRAVVAHLHAELGDREEAARHLAVVLRKGLHKINRDWGWSVTMTSMAAALALLDDDRPESRDAAASLVELLEPCRGQLVVVAAATHCPGAFDRYRAMLLSRLARWDEAEAAFAAALRLEEAAPSPPLAARTRYWYARMLLRRDDGDDTARARDLLDRCLADATALGMARVVTDAERLYACV